MSFLINLLNPVPTQGNQGAYYQYLNSVYDNLQGLQYVMNPSVITNADFSTLGSSGMTPITQADGNGAEFSDNWDVFGSTVANYTLTPTAYPSNSTFPTASPYFINVNVTSWNGNAFYFYQRQAETVRKYQKNYLTYGLIVNNNQSQSIKVRLDIFSYFNPSSTLTSGYVITLPTGITQITSTLLTDVLSGSVGASPYTEFRFTFIDLPDGTADFDLYQIKNEFGKVSTLLA